MSKQSLSRRSLSKRSLSKLSLSNRSLAKHPLSKYSPPKSRWPRLGLIFVFALLLSGCGAPSGTNASTQVDLSIALPEVTTPLTTQLPASSQAESVLAVTSNVFDPLVFWDEQTGQFLPGIASSWEQVSDTEMDLTIRQDVTFHDGTPLTADDVAFTLSEERLWGDQALAPSSLASTFSAVEIIDAQTVRITTSQPHPALLAKLASAIAFVVPADYVAEVGLEAFGMHPIGTGPYEVVDVTPGESIELAANADYWGGDVAYDTITFHEVAEASTRVEGLSTGEYDLVTNLPPDQVGVVEANAQSIFSVDGNSMIMLGFMTAHEDSPLAEPKVRHAMLTALDRQGLIDNLWSGKATVPDGFNLTVYQGFYKPKSAPIEQDTEAAKLLLEETGYHGETIRLQYVSGRYPNLDEAIDLMVAMWDEAGLMVDVQGVDDEALLDFDNIDGYFTASDIVLADPISPMWTDWVAPNSDYLREHRGSLSPELIAAGMEFSTSFDETIRLDSFTEARGHWNEELPAFAIWQPTDIYGAGGGVDFVPDSRSWLRMAEIPKS